MGNQYELVKYFLEEIVSLTSEELSAINSPYRKEQLEIIFHNLHIKINSLDAEKVGEKYLATHSQAKTKDTKCLG